MLRVWNITLVVVTFLLTVLGTFLTRSGILSSVHAFTEGTIGIWFLAFIAVVLLASLVILMGRSTELTTRGNLDRLVSRETAFLVNNLFLAAFCFTVLLGTLFPLVAAFRDVKVSVGPPFFNRMTVPLMVGLLFLLGVGPALPWRGLVPGTARRQFLPPLVAAILVAALGLILRVPSGWALAAFAFAAFAATANAQEFFAGTAARMKAHGEMLPVAFGRLVMANRRRYGGYIAHFGIIAAAVGITASSTYRSEREVTLKPGQTVELQGYTVRLDELSAQEEPQRVVITADMSLLSADGKSIASLRPRQNFFKSSDQPVNTPGVRSTARNDLYINLLAFERDGSSATVHVIVQPLVGWIWLGGLVVAFGAAFGTVPLPRRVRRRVYA